MGFASRRPDWSLPQLDIDLILEPFNVLHEAAARQSCPKCQKSRSLYCYDCLVAFTQTPAVQLPFQLIIVTHHAEKASKATGVHAALLCPGQVLLSSIDELPNLDASRCAVMFPSDDAVLPEELDMQQVSHLLIIDAAWKKARELNQHPALAGMLRVKLAGQPRSCFWRFHTKGVADEGVCTIEALHLLMKAMAGNLPQPPCNGNPHYFDNLLWYFAYQHQRVQNAATRRQELHRTRAGEAEQRMLQNDLMNRKRKKND